MIKTVISLVKSLPGPFYYASRVEVDASNNIYVTGSMWLTNPVGDTTHDSVLIKYSPPDLPYGPQSSITIVRKRPTSLVISPDSSRIGIAGVSGNLFMALMYDLDGNQLWANTDSNIYPANDLAFGRGNISYFAAGTYFQFDPNPYQMAIVKFDAAGNEFWIKSYSVGDRVFYIGVDPWKCPGNWYGRSWLYGLDDDQDRRRRKPALVTTL